MCFAACVNDKNKIMKNKIEKRWLGDGLRKL